ncbi:MAG: hypothetical protein RJA70_1325 [Pseudomonadota bacterium]|jgi:hypothetical protein
MSCPDCRASGRKRLLWFSLVVTVLLAFAYFDRALSKETSAPITTAPLEIHR